MHEPLTDLKIRRLKPPANDRIELTVGKVPGLKFRLTSKGRATWSLQVNINGRKRRLPVGEYPAIGLKEARQRGQRLRVEALDGRDPILERRKRQEEKLKNARTVSDALHEYVELHLKPNLRTADERERQLRAALANHLVRPVSEIALSDLQNAIDQKVRDGAPVAANRIRAALMAFFSWCSEKKYIGENIGTECKKVTTESVRERLLTIEEVRSILDASKLEGELWRPYIKILIYTAQRRGDVAGMGWSEVEFKKQQWTIPGRRTKNKTRHIVHLAAPVMDELVYLKEISDPDCDLIFSTTGNTPVSGFGKVKLRLDAATKILDWRFHDLRTVFATELCERGQPESVVDRILNHAATGSAPSTVARVYNQSEYLKQRAAALNLWAEVLQSSG